MTTLSVALPVTAEVHRSAQDDNELRWCGFAKVVVANRLTVKHDVILSGAKDLNRSMITTHDTGSRFPARTHA
jgi:hypothetical protein